MILFEGVIGRVLCVGINLVLGSDRITRKFIPSEEYLYSKLQKYDKPDYSTVILELCRAIKNEFLLKIFRKYTLDLIEKRQRVG